MDHEGNGPLYALPTYPAALTISAQAASSITSMPRAAACFSLEPAPGPATTRSVLALTDPAALAPRRSARSEEHTSELQSLMRISYAVFCLKKKNNNTKNTFIANT